MRRGWKDYYETLGVKREATEKQVKEAYRRLARRYHPDVTPGDQEAEEKFKEINEAYSVLGDAEKRRQYDAMGPEFFRTPGASTGGGGWRQGYVDLGDLGGANVGDFGDLFSSLFGGGTVTGVRRAPEAGADVTQEIEIGVAESVTGTEKTLRVDMEDYCEGCSGTGAEMGPCGTCRGTGQSGARGFMGVAAPCPACGGSGQAVIGQCRKCRGAGTVRRRRKLQVKIPAGVEDGSKIRLAGEGQAGRYGGPRGDLLLNVRLQKDGVFAREGPNVVCEVPVTFAEAALGAEIRVPTIEGTATLKVPAGTQSGQVLRLAGLGAPRLRGGGKGDQLVRVKVVVPRNLSAGQRETVSKTEGLYGADPRAELFKD